MYKTTPKHLGIKSIQNIEEKKDELVPPPINIIIIIQLGTFISLLTNPSYYLNCSSTFREVVVWLLVGNDLF